MKHLHKFLLRQKIKFEQLKARIAVNEEIIVLYWDIGKSIVEKQYEFAWGSKVLEQMAKDLKKELPTPRVSPEPTFFRCVNFTRFTRMRQFYSKLLDNYK